MLVVAAMAAAASALAVPPDEAYLGYFDWKTLGCLFCVLAVASALRLMGAFDRAARAVIARFRSPRPLALALVLTTAGLSCVATNDMALIMMLPLSAATLMGANLPRLVAPVFVLQSLAANLCGMIVPFGNPQNLYLYSYYGLGLGDFLATMALPFALSTISIVACTWWLCGRTDSSSPSDTRNLAMPMPLGRRRLAAYGLLFALTLLAVFRIVSIAAAVATVAAALAALDRRALAAVDWGLLATFACFFVFAGNMARVPEVSAWLSPLMADHGLLGQRRLKPDHQQRTRGRAALPFHGRMAAPARRREHRRRRHARRLTCEPHHAAALHQRAQNLPPSDRVARAIHWSLPRPVQRAELWFPGHSLDCLRDGVFLLEKYFDFERFF